LSDLRERARGKNEGGKNTEKEREVGRNERVRQVFGSRQVRSRKEFIEGRAVLSLRASMLANLHCRPSTGYILESVHFGFLRNLFGLLYIVVKT
jgi:hypothetical protein